jgi:hypothetical protein
MTASRSLPRHTLLQADAPLDITSMRRTALLKLDPGRYLHYYNTERAHTGCWAHGRTPDEVLEKAKQWHNKR